MAKIISISEILNWQSKLDGQEWQRFDGYEVVTESGSTRIGISNGQSCCETTGYFWSEDDVSSFVGADLLEVAVVDTELNVKKHVDNIDEGEMMFVNFTTDRGVLQFVAYNIHNGYYGHDAIVESDNFSHRTSL